MKAKDFNDLLKSIDETRAIKAGKRRPSRMIRFIARRPSPRSRAGSPALMTCRIARPDPAPLFIDREIMAVDAELHADLEALLLQDGSAQRGLWGINLYPELPGDQWIEFDSMINMRPSQGNRSRGVEDEALRSRVVAVVEKRLAR